MTSKQWIENIVYQQYSNSVDANMITTYGRELRMIPPFLGGARPTFNLKKKEWVNMYLVKERINAQPTSLEWREVENK